MSEQPTAQRRSSGINAKWNGLPIWAWIFLVTLFVGIVWMWRRNKSKSSSQPASTAQPVSTAGDYGNIPGQVEYIYSALRNLQGLTPELQGVSGQVTDVSGQVSGVSQQVSNIPAGPPGAAGPPGPPGPPPPAPAPPPAPPPPPSGPKYVGDAQVHTDGRITMHDLLGRYPGSTIADILAHTRQSEPTDSYSSGSALKRYFDSQHWTNPIPPGFTMFIPVYRR